MATNRAENRPKQVSMIHGKQTKHRWAVKKDIQSSRRKERFEQWLSLSPFACFTYVEETGIKSVSSKANSKQKEKEKGGVEGGRINKPGARCWHWRCALGPVHTGTGRMEGARKETTRRRLKKRVYCCRGSFPRIVSTGSAFKYVWVSVPVSLCMCVNVCERVYGSALVIYSMFR